MILVVLVAVTLMALIISWVRQLPGSGERLGDLSLKRRALCVAAVPISICVTAGFAFVAVDIDGATNQPGYADEVLIASAGAAASGFSNLLFVALARLIKALKVDATPERQQMSPPTRSPGYNTWQGRSHRDD